MYRVRPRMLKLSLLLAMVEAAPSALAGFVDSVLPDLAFTSASCGPRPKPGVASGISIVIGEVADFTPSREPRVCHFHIQAMRVSTWLSLPVVSPRVDLRLSAVPSLRPDSATRVHRGRSPARRSLPQPDGSPGKPAPPEARAAAGCERQGAAC